MQNGPFFWCFLSTWPFSISHSSSSHYKRSMISSSIFIHFLLSVFRHCGRNIREGKKTRLVFDIYFLTRMIVFYNNFLFFKIKKTRTKEKNLKNMFNKKNYFLFFILKNISNMFSFVFKKIIINKVLNIKIIFKILKTFQVLNRFLFYKILKKVQKSFLKIIYKNCF